MDVSKLGFGVLIDLLGGNKSTVEAVQASLGKTITSMRLEGDTLVLRLNDGSKLSLWDNGQSCCESRYMRTDEKVSQFSGAKLLNIELSDVENRGGGEEHEVQFLRIHTDKGIAVFSNHNKHNGYYGGFSINASLSTPHIRQ